MFACTLFVHSFEDKQINYLTTHVQEEDKQIISRIT